MGRFEQSGPEEVSSRRAGQVGFALYQAQVIKNLAVPLRRKLRWRTYRTVYTVRFKAALYVLHAFQKKAKQGIATPKQEIDLVKHRLKAAEQHYTDTYGEG